MRSSCRLSCSQICRSAFRVSDYLSTTEHTIVLSCYLFTLWIMLTCSFRQVGLQASIIKRSEQPFKSLLTDCACHHLFRIGACMNTDGRYMYNSAQPMATTYDYAPYPTSAYDTTQIPPQPQVRSMRQTPSQPHSPHQPQPPFNSPPAQYPPQPSPYVTPSHPHAHPQYAMPPPPAAQWTQESWNHYNQYQQPPIPDVGFQSGPGRPEPPSNPAPPPPAPPSDQRSYAPSQTSPDVRHDEEHYVLTPVAMAPSKPPRRRDKDTPSSTQSPSTPSVLDFAKVSPQISLSTALT